MKLKLSLLILAISSSLFAGNRTIYKAEHDPSTRVICTNYKQLWQTGDAWMDDYTGTTFSNPNDAYQVIGKLNKDGTYSFDVQNFPTDKILYQGNAIKISELEYQGSSNFSLTLLEETTDRNGQMDAKLTFYDSEEIEVHCYNPRDLGI